MPDEEEKRCKGFAHRVNGAPIPLNAVALWDELSETARILTSRVHATKMAVDLGKTSQIDDDYYAAAGDFHMANRWLMELPALALSDPFYLNVDEIYEDRKQWFLRSMESIIPASGIDQHVADRVEQENPRSRKILRTREAAAEMIDTLWQDLKMKVELAVAQQPQAQGSTWRD